MNDACACVDVADVRRRGAAAAIII